MAYSTVIMDTSKCSSSSNEVGKDASAIEAASNIALTPSSQPIIEIATYAETDVYECYIRGFESRIVMRRTHDDWVNITQVFKIAQFSKTQRTKVLEKESNDMRHEKVQGGYGRFQGTWIPLENAKYMVKKYNIKDPVVTTILSYEFDPCNPPMKRSKNSVLKRTSPNGRISSPSSYNKTPKKKHHANSSATTRKSKKINMMLQPNPSPLQNLVFQTPQQAHLSATNAATTISAVSNAEELSNGKKHSISQLNANETPLTLGYSATQKPLQFYPVPTTLTHPQKLIRNNNNVNVNHGSNNGTEAEKSNSQPFLTFVSEGPNAGVFSSQQSHVVPNILVNGAAKQISRKRKKDRHDKIDENSIEMLSGNTDSNETNSLTSKQSRSNSMGRQQMFSGRKRSVAQDKTQQHFKMMKQQVLWQNARSHGVSQSSPNNVLAGSSGNTHSNTSSIEMFSTHENPTPLSSRSSSPTNYVGIPTAPATAIENETENIEPAVLGLEEYKEMILEVLSSEDGSDKDYSLPSQMYHPPSNLDINFEIDDQGHTPLHWATAMANISLIKLLIALNANALQCNTRGFNCITKSIFYNNCFKADTFSEIVSILRICLITPDSNGRLPLHYLVELSVNKSKDPLVINSYMDTILQNLGQEDYTLLRMCLNFQDGMGNTVLHLAALNLNLELCNKLCYLGSSMDITNCNSETPASILAKYNLVPPTSTNAHMSSHFAKTALSSHPPTTSSTLAAAATTTPRPIAQMPQDETQREAQYANVHEGIRPVTHDEPHQNDENFQSQIKMTPGISTKKASSRNYLSGQDSTTFTTLMDDLSNMDSFVTSSVLRDVKTTPSKLLERSPILYKKRPSTANALLSTNLKKPGNLGEAMQSPLVPIVASPGSLIQKGKQLNGVLALVQKLNEISSSVTISINSKVNSVTTEIENAESGIKCIKNNLENVSRIEKELLMQFNDGDGVESLDQLEAKTNETKHLVNDGKQSFAQCIEKSQALGLATLVQEEESKVNAEPTRLSSPEKLQNMESLRLATELALLQFKRRLGIERISDARCRINSSSKINKYRRLIGLTIENIDSKLDEIEQDLRACT